ncbi:MAG: peptide chain release factor-like protein [Phycisphaerales bacterium]|nr:peptide chain release factor-like protein [Phycisphaerales bacterium]
MDPFAAPNIERWPHPACLADEELLKHCTVGRDTSGGPGGQNRNKVETQITITHSPTAISAQAGERRSQIENKRMAMRRLRLALALGVRSAVPTGPIGSNLWRSRLRNGKVACNPEHQDYPCLLAEAMDVLAASGNDPSKAALRLECSASQLVKLLKDHPHALVQLNAARKAAGKHPLR